VGAIFNLDCSHFFLSKEQPAATSRAKREINVRHNDEKSGDIYFGPSAPKGFEKNWISTAPGRSWFVQFRLYGPLEAYFDRSWPLADIEKVN
jgi:hypothetical protein